MSLRGGSGRAVPMGYETEGLLAKRPFWAAADELVLPQSTSPTFPNFLLHVAICILKGFEENKGQSYGRADPLHPPPEGTHPGG